VFGKAPKAAELAVTHFGMEVSLIALVLDLLKQNCLALTYTYTGSRQSAAGLRAQSHLLDERSGQTDSASSKRVPNGNGASLTINGGLLKPEFSNYRQDLSGEGLVNFDFI
jgi:hypothetical protein